MALTKVTGPGIVTTTNLRVGILTADNITIGGTITYENVTEIDSVGVVTAQGGLHVGAGGTILHILSKDNGKVGIGSTVPTGSLDIYGGDDNPGLTLKRNTGGGDVASIAWHALNASPTTVAKINYRGGAAPGGMQFYTGGGTSSERRMVINTAGLIGIGSDGPTKTLDIKATNPTINVKASTDNDASLELIETSGAQNFGATGAHGYRIRYDGGDNRLYIASGNNDTVNNVVSIDRDTGALGIGLDGPTARLHVNGTTNGLQARFGGTGTGLGVSCAQKTNANALVKLIAQDASYGTLTFWTAGAERVRIASTGKIVASTNTTTTASFDYLGLHFTSDNSTVAEGLFINNIAANTGDNASISFSCDSGNRKKSAISHVDTGNYGRGDLVFSIDPDADSGELDIVAHEKLRITSEGKVGIGTNDPERQFHVVGTSTVTDNAWFGGNVHIADDKQLNLGNDSNLYIKHSHGHANNFIVSSVGDIEHHMALSKKIIKGFNNSGAPYVNLYYDNTIRLTTTGVGITVSGITTATNFDLSAIAATAYDSSNVVDVFVYDTSQDTDGGEWRKRCGNTSWYHETFSATRGSKKEFPAVAVIVLVGGTVSSYGSDNNTQKICIYDGDDPTLPLWMEFQGHADEDGFIRGAANYPQTSVDMFNGQMIIGRNGGYGIATINFIHDRLISYWDTGNIGYFDGNISERNIGKGVNNVAGYGIINVTINDVAITAIKDSPIDITTGLPYPTMALATNDGLCVISSHQGSDKEKHRINSSKATHASYNQVQKVAMNRYTNKLYFISEGGSIGLLYEYDLPWGKDFTQTTMTGYTGVAWLNYGPHGIQGTSGAYQDYHPKFTNTKMALRKNGEIWTVSGDGIAVWKPDFNSDYTLDNTALVAGIGTHHNSGWMYGRGADGCKIGSLCETTAGILGNVGTNLVTNSTFESNIIGWDDIATSYTTETHTSGKLQLVASGGTARVEEEVTVVSGKRYTYEYQCVSNGGGSNFSHLSTASNGGGTIYATNIGISNTGYHQHTFTASATSLFIQLGATNGTTAQFDNVRVYETSECVENGYFNTTPDGQPGHDNGDNTVDGWSAVASSELSIDNYALKIEHTQSGSWSGGGAQYALGNVFVPGVQYCVRYRVKTGGNTGNFTQGIGARIQKDNQGHSNYTLLTLVNETSDPGGSWVEKVTYFTAERANYGIHFYCYYGVDGFIFYIDNLSIKPVANSYAITNQFDQKPMGLEPRGRITKEAVATGAELCCYKGFDAYNSLVQRYTSQLDYGTGDFYYMVWVNCSMNGSGNVEGLISRQANEQESGNRIQIQADNNRNVFLYCGGFNDDTTANLSKAGWTHIAFIRRGQMGYFYEDGRLRKYFSDTTNYTNSGANLRIGGLSLGSSIEDNSYPADQTKFALFKTGGTAPSELELRQIVMEERKFFGTNVKCTLYGTSDYQIPAVACDIATDTVHVGTASGRSEFDGLLRINNTTDAITVAVSASNGFVAEE